MQRSPPWSTIEENPTWYEDMTKTLDLFERSTHTTNLWLAELSQALGQEDRAGAYRVLRAVLHTLRDRVPHNEATQFAAQLPTLLRGVFYEGWRPAQTPEPYRDVETFLTRIATEAGLVGETEASLAVAATMSVLHRHVSGGELDDVLSVMPASLRTLLYKTGNASS